MAVNTAKISCQGGRNYNEDSISIDKHKKSIYAIAADGLGGHGGGDKASSSAIEAITSFIKNEETITEQNLREAVSYANKTVSLLDGPKTTVALLYINENTALTAHVGDSRIYQFRGGKIIFQSQDHSVSQMAVIVGEITKDQIRSHADRNRLLRALGNPMEVNAEINELSVKKDDAFLLCTDGFWELVLEEEMEQSLESAKNAQKWLNNMCLRLEKRLTDKSDNYSAITIIV